MQLSYRPLALFALMLVPVLAHAQDAVKPPPLKIVSVRVGFKGYDPNMIYSKAGMWAPVEVKVQVGEEKIDGAKMTLETVDNEDTPTITTIPLRPMLAEEKAIFRAYTLPGHMSSELKVRIKTKDKTYEKDVTNANALRQLTSTQLYLTLGAKLPDLNKSLLLLRLQELPGNPLIKQAPGVPNVNPKAPAPAINNSGDDESAFDTSPRYAAFETDPQALPDKYQGYQSVDLIILSTDKQNNFVSSLTDQNDLSRLRALSEWVRRGGHMVISVHWNNQAEVARLMAHPAWQPRVPVQFAASYDPKKDPLRLRNVEQWAQSNSIFEMPNKKDKVPIAQLVTPDGRPADWDAKADYVSEDGEALPLITRMPYGLGSITFLAFSIDPGSPFSKWEGRVDFWKQLIKTCAPALPQGEVGRTEIGGYQDVLTKLHNTLHTFDVKIVPFGWVALFILIYIIIVGPIDYLVLKYVFKRLEWTWITFPVVVFAISFAAYFTAYAIKGRELRTNQIDVVDIDMRTELNDKMQPARAYVYGQTFFALLSPRIQNYTIGMELNPNFWGPDLKNPQADMVSWLGKGLHGYGGAMESPQQGYFRRSYQINDPTDQAIGLIGVPIAVWASKSFTATWGSALSKLPLGVDLVYHQNRKDGIVVTGNLTNNLPIDLEDVWLSYCDLMYCVSEEPFKKASQLKVSVPLLAAQKTLKPHQWVSLKDTQDDDRTRMENGSIYNPTTTIKQTYVFIKSAGFNVEYNQWLRRLDASWRMQEIIRPADTRLREAIIYARVRFRSGLAPDIYNDTDQPIPTQIWLGQLPGQQTAPNQKLTRPELTGHLNQDTYVRILVPVRPAP